MTTSKKPSAIEPMLATLTKDIFQSDDWVYEIKWDGYRIISHLNKSQIILHSRSLQNYTNKYPPIVAALQALKLDAILDGEIVVLDENDRPNFDELQRYRPGMHLRYYLFDIIWLKGKDFTKIPLAKRKETLRNIIPEDHEILKFSDSFDDGEALFNKMKELGMEGVLAKIKDSLYSPGKRTKEWLKIPTAKQQEFVVGGWAESTSGRPFRTLIFGYYEKGKLIYQGHAGGGFKEKDMPGIYKRLQKLEVKKSPFANTDTVLKYTETPIHWVKPELVIQVKYATITRSGMIRKPATFLGFREDKDPKEAVLEKPIAIKTEKKHLSQHEETSEASNWPVVESIHVTSKDEFNIDGNRLFFTNVEKQLWKGITKADLLSYYNNIAPFILPHLQGRPLSLHIKHIAPTVEGLYIKDMEGRQPSWAQIFNTPRKHKKKGMRGEIDYLVCNEKATLLWMINLGCIDVNPWTSTVSESQEPTWIVIDLDPSDDDFSKVIEPAMVVREYLKKFKLIGFPKTSGKTGIHIFIPCTNMNFEQARLIAIRICDNVHSLIPELTTTNINKNSREGKVYLDPNQNDYADTVAAPYSVRPFELPTVSTPLDWREIKPGLNAESFTIDTILPRLEKKGDLFKGVLDETIAFKNYKSFIKYFL